MFFKKKKSWVYRASDTLRTVRPMDNFFSKGCWHVMQDLFNEVGGVEGYENKTTHEAFDRFTKRYKQYLEVSQKMHQELRDETMADLKALSAANGHKVD
jgi:hypothetical protein